MKGVARRWRSGFWRVRFDNGLDLYPITTEELARAMRHHDITVRNAKGHP